MNRYNQKEYFSGNGIDLARLALDKMDLSDITVEKNEIGDHYDPITKIVSLTDERCGRRTLTAVVVAAHEVGHAIQDHSGYGPFQARTSMVGAAAKFERIGAFLMMGVPLLAVITRIPAPLSGIGQIHPPRGPSGGKKNTACLCADLCRQRFGRALECLAMD